MHAPINQHRKWLNKHAPYLFKIVVPDTWKTRHVRPKTSLCSWITRTTNSSQCPSPEVVACKDYSCLILRNSLHIICPSSCKFDGSFSTFDTSVHWKNSVISKVRCHELDILAKTIVVEGSRCKSYFLCLFNKSTNDLGMAMPLVYSRIGWNK